MLIVGEDSCSPKKHREKEDYLPIHSFQEEKRTVESFVQDEPEIPALSPELCFSWLGEY